jgi:hypothetical protein
MQNSCQPDALHAALRFVVTSSIPSAHKATLIDVLVQAVRDAEANESPRHTSTANRTEWQEHEIELLKSFLRDRVATSWQDADESVMQLAMQLDRDPRAVREKATEVGLGIAVDYWLSKSIQKARAE